MKISKEKLENLSKEKLISIIQQQQDSGRKYEALFQQAFQLSGLLTPEGILLEANQTSLNFIGVRASDVYGKSFWDTPWWNHSSEVQMDLKKAIEKAAKGEIARFQATHMSSDNSKHYMDVSVKPLFDDDGKVVMLIPEGRDVTEQKTLEEQLYHTQKREAIGTLAGGIAHDFNNILTAIIGYAQLVQSDDGLTKDNHEQLGKLLVAAKRASDLVKQILTFSRHAEDELNNIMVGPIVKEIIKFMRASLPSSIEINEYITPGDLSVMGSATQIHQIVMNLFTNAAHAIEEKNEEGTIIISLSPCSVDLSASRAFEITPGEYIKLTINDNGIGISRDIQDRIFDPYFTTKEQGKGTGLGLSIVRGIVDKWGGCIKVEGIPQVGTTVTIYLPLYISQELTNIEEMEVPHGHEHILLVDDEYMVADAAKRMVTIQRDS